MIEIGVVFTAVSALCTVVTEIRSQNTSFEASLRNIDRNLTCLKSTLEDVKNADINLGVPDEKADKFVNCLKKGDKLLHKCRKINPMNFIGRYFHSSNLTDFDNELTKFLQIELLMRINNNNVRLLIEMNKLHQKLDFHLKNNSGCSSAMTFFFGLVVGAILFGGKIDSAVYNCGLTGTRAIIFIMINVICTKLLT